MYSNTLYLFAEKYIPEAKMLDWKEELPSGAKVNQKKLGELSLVAALVYLREKGFIELDLQERKILFVKTRELVVKHCKEDDGSLNGLESVIHQIVKDEMKLDTVIWNILPREVMNPWSDIISITKQALTEKGILGIEPNGKILFITRTKSAIQGDLPEEEAQRVHDWNQALENFEATGDLYKKTCSIVENMLYNRQYQNN
jgi:hypothetical protein